MDNASLQIIGVGSPLFDHIFSEDQNERLLYRSSRGGGTISNILANLAYMGIKNTLIGYCGGLLPYGKIAIDELEKLGVDTKFVIEKPTDSITIMYQRSKNNETPTHTFTTKCIVCGFKPNKKRQKDHQSFLSFLPKMDWDKVKILVTDKITTERIKLVQEAKKINPNIIAVIDIGHILNLRYCKINRIVELLSTFDVVFINSIVYRFLDNRCRKENMVFPIFVNQYHSPLLIVVTKDKDGLDYYIKDDSDFIYGSLSSLTEKIVCTSGAGDNLLANFLLSIINYDVGKHFFSDPKLVVNCLTKSISNLSNVLGNLGARGHLPNHSLMDIPTRKFIDLDIDSIRKTIKDDDICPFCWRNEIERKISKSKNLENVINDLPLRAENILSTPNILATCQEIMKFGNSYTVVGTGGSHSPALFISQLLKSKQKISFFSFPYDYHKGTEIKTDWLIVLSYSGNTADCGLAIEKAKEIGVKRIALITGHKKPGLSKYLSNIGDPEQDMVISYGNSNYGREKGFLSFTGSIIPSLIFASCSCEDLDQFIIKTMFDEANTRDFELLGEFTKSLIKYRCVDLIGGSFAWPAMVDLESKLVEGGVCAVQIHESKDFSHGRFMQSLKRPGLYYPKILLQVGDDEYEDYLYEVLKLKAKHTPIIRMKSCDIGIKGGLELLIDLQHFIFQLSLLLYGENRDITKPSTIPIEGLHLYRWKKS